jgi:hypothetical protein
MGAIRVISNSRQDDATKGEGTAQGLGISENTEIEVHPRQLSRPRF